MRQIEASGTKPSAITLAGDTPVTIVVGSAGASRCSQAGGAMTGRGGQPSEAMRALQQSEERHALVCEAATEGIYDWNIADNKLYVSPRLNRMFGFAAGEFVSEAWFERVHAEERDIYRQALVDLFTRNTDRLKVEYRILNVADAYIWVRDNGVAVRDGAGRAVRLVGAVADITEEKQREAERTRLVARLAEARDEAMQATQAKSRFLASMSHELRTPLNAIIGITELLEEDVRLDDLEDYIEPLQRISRAGKHLLRLISDVLDLSKIEAGRVELYLEPIDLRAFVDELAGTVRPLADQRQNQLRVGCARDIGHMHADLTRLRQIVLNLLSNACKFTEGGKVDFEVARAPGDGGDWITVPGRDSGIGITEAQMTRLFQEFSQGDAATTRQFGGTGLGLAISERLARMMGGDITVESRPGAGSTFCARLPAVVEGETNAASGL